MPVQRIVTTVGLVSPAGTTVTTLSAASITLTLDEGTAPFATASVSVAMPTPAQFAMMKPGAGYYLSLLNYPATSPETVPTLLRITDRSRGTDGNVELQAASAELDLISYTPSAVDVSNMSRQSSAVNILSNVFGRVWGANGWARYLYAATDSVGQEVGTPAYPTFSDVANLIPNGGFEYNLNPWGATVLTSRDTSQKHGGAASMKTTPNSSSLDTYAEVAVNLAPATTYTISGWLYQSTASAPAHERARTVCMIGAAGNVPYVVATSPQAPNTAGRWMQAVLRVTTPPILDAGSVRIRLYNGSGNGNSNTVWWDDIMIVEGDGLDTDGVSLVPYFDGDTANTAQYTYTWDGTPGLSSAKRTSTLKRDKDALIWSPGQSAWDFLQPILQTLGIRLWSLGYAVSGNGSVVAKLMYATNQFGLTTAAPRVMDGFNLFDITQVDSWSAEFPDGTPMYADQVIIHYQWSDASGAPQEAYDVYPASGKKPYYLEKTDTPFPGAGRAQGIYNRISARATMFQGTAWFNRAIEPGRQLSITSAQAAGGSVLGYIEAATYDPGRGTVEFRTKNTVSYTAQSWFAATGTWASQSGSWAADQ